MEIQITAPVDIAAGLRLPGQAMVEPRTAPIRLRMMVVGSHLRRHRGQPTPVRNHQVVQMVRPRRQKLETPLGPLILGSRYRQRARLLLLLLRRLSGRCVLPLGMRHQVRLLTHKSIRLEPVRLFLGMRPWPLASTTFTRGRDRLPRSQRHQPVARLLLRRIRHELSSVPIPFRTSHRMR
ncbi:Uncharacterised protein [Mycobacteroides abscessus subsp. abscessus]|nr:Uncharacterised protein [Mycobacteroides abscessus subsp. abscessus]